MTEKPGLFPTFFLSGFECSTFVWKDQGRRDLCAETQHGRYADDDYAFLASLGIGVAREGVPWPTVDRGDGAYDFSCIEPFIAAMRRHKVLPIWDLCHYGYPDDADPFAPDFAPRFAAYAKATAEHVAAALPGPHFFTPVNEITFFGFMAGEWGWAAPFGKSREERLKLRLAVCAADIAAVKAIREVVPDARMVHIDPLILVVPPRDRPDLADEAWTETFDDAFFAFDVISGRKHPELGGAPDVLDVAGLNHYSFGQMEYREDGPHAALKPGDPRIVPMADLLERAWKRYGRPIVVGETSGLEGGRDDWLNDVVGEALAAVNRGVDLHGICLFPAVDMPDWHTGKWLHNGIADLERQPDGTLRRAPFQPYVDALHRWQRELNRVERLDADPQSDPVELADIVAAARRLRPKADADWH
jgi:beta-glucosidase/6-phospho-beta-glucosidase/beta-galactosidase